LLRIDSNLIKGPLHQQIKKLIYENNNLPFGLAQGKLYKHMKITICGSMHFAKEMLESQKLLEELGHEAIVPIDTYECLEDPSLNESIEHCQKFGDIDKDHFNKIAASDAILILNYPKNGISGYVGGAALTELGVARHLDKKIFILHQLPSEKDLRYALEIKIMKPIILNGDLNQINNDT